MAKTLTLIALVALIALTSCSRPDATIDTAHKQIAQSLDDPDARFRDDAIGSDGAVCGEVKGKNRTGGYTGFSSYVWTPKDGVTIFSGERASTRDTADQNRKKLKKICHFVKLWTMVCTEAQRTAMAGLYRKCAAKLRVTSHKHH